MSERVLNGGITEAEQIEANEFALSILMPRSMLAKDISCYIRWDGQTLISEAVAVLALRYNVSETMMRYRLMELGFLPPI